jgi:hypothetical protein
MGDKRQNTGSASQHGEMQAQEVRIKAHVRLMLSRLTDAHRKKEAAVKKARSPE